MSGRFSDPAWSARPVATALRVAESLVRRRSPRLRRPVVDVGGGLLVRVDLGTARGLGLFRYGLREPEQALVERVLAPGDTFVDGGAHMGLFSLVAARRVGPSGSVLAFEPSRANGDALLENVRLNGFDWVELDRRALIDEEGEAPFLELPGDRSGLSSLTPAGAAGAGVVGTTTIDAAVGDRPVRLLKLDVEGVEALALRGAARVLAAQRPDLLVEVVAANLAAHGSSPAELDEILRGHGYRVFEPQPDGGLRPLASCGELASGPNVFATASAA